MKVDKKLIAGLVRDMGLSKVSLNILRYGLVSKGWLRITNLDTAVSLRVDGVEDGLYSLSDLAKGVPFNGAMDAKQVVDDFPSPIDLSSGDGVLSEHPIPSGFIPCLMPVLFAVDTDGSRSALGCVSVELDRGVTVATDGRRLAIRNFDKIKKDSLPVSASRFMVKPDVIRVLSRLSLDGELDTPWVSVVSVRTKTYIETKKILGVSADDWKVRCRLEEGEYPDWPKVMPKHDKGHGGQFVVMPEAVDQIVGGLDRLNPLSNAKTNMLYFGEDRLTIRDADKDIEYFVDVPWQLRTDGKAQGINGKFLRELLANMTGNVRVTYSLSPISAITFVFDGGQGLLMPLRVMDGDEDTLLKNLPPLKKSVKV